MAPNVGQGKSRRGEARQAKATLELRQCELSHGIITARILFSSSLLISHTFPKSFGNCFWRCCHNGHLLLLCRPTLVFKLLLILKFIYLLLISNLCMTSILEYGLLRIFRHLHPIFCYTKDCWVAPRDFIEANAAASYYPTYINLGHITMY